MHTQTTLAQLYPVGEKGVVFVYLVGELKDICIAVLAYIGVLARTLDEHAHLIDDTVNKWGDTVDERHLGAVFNTLEGIFLTVHLAYLSLLINLLYSLLCLLATELLLLLPLAQGLEKGVEFVATAILAREMTK